MKFNRRHFCSTLAIGSTGIVGGAVSAQSEIQITGSIDSEVDATLSGVDLFFQQVDTGSKWTYTVPEDGSIDLTVSEAGTYRVRLFNTSSRNENVPLVYSLGQTTIEDGNSGVDYTIPESYDTRIRCVDSDGEPVKGLQIMLRAGGVGQSLFSTSDQGYVKFDGTSVTNLQLRGRIRVDAQSNQDTGIQSIGTIDVSEPTEIELTISNLEEYSNIQKVEKNPANGFHYPYFLYTPPASQVTDSGNGTINNINPRPLLVRFVTWDSKSERIERVGEDMDALNYVKRGITRAIADELNIPAMVALLPDGTPDGEFELLNRNALEISEPPNNRLDLQLFSMVDDAKQRLAEQPYDIADKIHLDGFSSNGVLCSQLSMLHPERINAVSSGGYGYHPIPKSEYKGDIPVQSEPGTSTLEWPVGIADLPDIIGKDFDKKAWLDIAQYCYIGGDDQGNPDKSDLGNEYIHARGWEYLTPSRKRRQLLYDIFGWENVDERFTTSRRIYEAVGANATFKIYDGVGHDRTSKMESDIVDFHREQMISEFPTGNIQTSDTTEETNSGSDDESSAESSESTTDTQPGFGLTHTIATLGGLCYLIRNRSRSK